MELKDGLMAQAALLLPGKPANNYMVAVLFEGERQVNIAPLSGCKDGCTAALTLAIEYLRSHGHSGMAQIRARVRRGVLVPPTKRVHPRDAGRAPHFSHERTRRARRALGRRVLEPIRGSVK